MNVTHKQETLVEAAIRTGHLAFASRRTLDPAFRMHQLRQLLRLIEENEQDFIKTLSTDLRKPRFETILVETDFVANDCRFQMYNLHSHIKDEKKTGNLVSMFDGNFVRPEPYGLVLIIGTWNYPLMVTLCPLIGAIAAGNCAIVKCSELAPQTGALLQKLCHEYLDNECYQVLNGEASVSIELLKHRFDYIFFTGSQRIGRIVHQAAAKHLTPVTLELGGKSPAYVDASLSGTSLHYAARRLIWGKMMNSGQTCVAPDYLIIHQQVKNDFINMIKRVFEYEFYSKFRRSKVQQSTTKSNIELVGEFDFQQGNRDEHGVYIDSVGNILNEHHFSRLTKMLNSTRGKIIYGGQVNQQELQIPFTLVDEISIDDSLMSEEIFGPILPIITVKSVKEAIDIINSKQKPLSLYIFANCNKAVNQILNETSSGSVCVNDCIIQLNVESLPFGGVGDSGFGVYHGKYSFDTFSHQKAVLYRGYNPILEWVASKRYEPYRMNYLRRLQRLLRKRNIPINTDYLCTILIFGLGILFTLAWQCLCGQFY